MKTKNSIFFATVISMAFAATVLTNAQSPASRYATVSHTDASASTAESLTITPKEIQLTDSLMFRVLHRDTYPSLELLKRRKYVSDNDTIYFIIPEKNNPSYLAICRFEYLDETTTDMKFTGYYKIGKYTFVFEKTLCDKFGKQTDNTTAITITSKPYNILSDPLVWHLIRAYNGDAYRRTDNHARRDGKSHRVAERRKITDVNYFSIANTNESISHYIMRHIMLTTGCRLKAVGRPDNTRRTWRIPISYNGHYRRTNMRTSSRIADRKDTEAHAWRHTYPQRHR